MGPRLISGMRGFRHRQAPPLCPAPSKRFEFLPPRQERRGERRRFTVKSLLASLQNPTATRHRPLEVSRGALPRRKSADRNGEGIPPDRRCAGGLGVRQDHFFPEEYFCILGSGVSDNEQKPDASDAADDLLPNFSNGPVRRAADPRRSKAYFSGTGESCPLRRCVPWRATPFDISSPDSFPPLSTVCVASHGHGCFSQTRSRAKVRSHAYCRSCFACFRTIPCFHGPPHAGGPVGRRDHCHRFGNAGVDPFVIPFRDISGSGRFYCRNRCTSTPNHRRGNLLCPLGRSHLPSRQHPGV